MKVLIDNGHGIETLGKRSPDGRLREYAYTREVADRVVKALTAAGIDAVRIVPEDADVPLSERCTRANALYTESGKQAVLVSIHCNAAGNGSAWMSAHGCIHCNAAGNGSAWMSAHGWSVFVDTTASQNSKRLATALVDVAESKGVTVRKQAGGRNYWIQNLYICKHTRCPAVLTENFFQDNKADVDFLLSEKGKHCVTDITVEGILNYLKVKSDVND